MYTGCAPCLPVTRLSLPACGRSPHSRRRLGRRGSEISAFTGCPICPLKPVCPEYFSDELNFFSVSGRRCSRNNLFTVTGSSRQLCADAGNTFAQVEPEIAVYIRPRQYRLLAQRSYPRYLTLCDNHPSEDFCRCISLTASPNGPPSAKTNQDLASTIFIGKRRRANWFHHLDIARTALTISPPPEILCSARPSRCKFLILPGDIKHYCLVSPGRSYCR